MKTIQQKSEELFDLLQSGQITKEYADSQMSKYEILTKILLGEITSNRADLSDANLSGTDLSEANMIGANLSGTNLSDANLRGAYLRGADLSDTNLIGANLRGANLSDANLIVANLIVANLSCANLRGANLRGADLSYANLRGADLSDANLRGADLSYANLSDTNLIVANLSDVTSNFKTLGYHLACPEEGSFIAWKKVVDCIIKLEIPADAKRSSATTLKCRCSYAKVLEIEGNEISTLNHVKYGQLTTYTVGEYVYPDSFDEDRWNECGNGIHFFMNKECARWYS